MDNAAPCHFFYFSNILHAIPIHPDHCGVVKTTPTNLGVEVEAEMRVALRKDLAVWQWLKVRLSM